MRSLAWKIGLVQAVLLALYAVATEVNALRDHSHVGSPLIAMIIMLILSALMFVVNLGVKGGHSAARTPYFMVQIFAVLIAAQFLQGSKVGVEARFAWGAVLVSAVAGFIALFRTPAD